MKKKVEKEGIYREIGERLKSARERLKFSQLHIAGVFGIGYQSLRRYENGETAIPLRLLYEFAEYYNIKPADLLPDPDGLENKKPFDNKVLLEKNISQLKKIYAAENEKAIKITNAAIDFLSKIADEI